MIDRNNPDLRFSEDDVRAVIGRAAELESTDSKSISLAELKQIAEELGISASDLDNAIEERVSSNVPSRKPVEVPGRPIPLGIVGAIGAIAMMTVPAVSF